MTSITRIAIVISMAFFSSSLQAGISEPEPVSPTTSTSPSETSDNEVYLGLEWQIGQSVLPEIELGYRNVDVESDGDVTGGQLSLSYDFGINQLSKLKLEGISGDDDVQGQLGLGYNLAQRGFLFTGGVQGNHIFAGLDYTLGSGGDVMAGFNTIGDYTPPAENTTLTCPEGTELSGDQCVSTEQAN